MQLYEHQKEIVKEVKKALKVSDRTRVIAPTGSGKTHCQVKIISDYLQSKKVTEPQVIVVNAPRIQLAIQLFLDYHTSKFQKFGDFRSMFVCTAGQDSRILCDANKERVDSGMKPLLTYDLGSTTSSKDIRDNWEECKLLGKHLIIFSTYHSSERIQQAGLHPAMTIADEAHYLVCNQFEGQLTEFNSGKWVFFTATERHTSSESGLGMNNVRRFGELAVSIPVKRLIDAGVITDLKLHFMTAKSTGDEERDDIKSIEEIAKKHEDIMQIDPVILVACTGTKQVDGLGSHFVKSDDFSDYTIFRITSSSGAFVNDRLVNRREFLRELQNVKGKALIFHYDILSEGIDCGQISGIVFLRNMNFAKKLQTIGRALRVLPKDRKLPLEQRQKPFALISVPVLIDEMESARQEIIDIYETLYVAGFDIPPEEIIVHQPRGKKEDDDDEFDRLRDKEDLINQFNELFDLEEIQHEIIGRDIERKERLLEDKLMNMIKDDFMKDIAEYC